MKAYILFLLLLLTHIYLNHFLKVKASNFHLFNFLDFIVIFLCQYPLRSILADFEIENNISIAFGFILILAIDSGIKYRKKRQLFSRS